MKKVIYLILIIVGFVSCKKYEDDPFYSTYTVKSRLTAGQGAKNEWNLVKYISFDGSEVYVPENTYYMYFLVDPNTIKFMNGSVDNTLNFEFGSSKKSLEFEDGTSYRIKKLTINKLDLVDLDGNKYYFELKPLLDVNSLEQNSQPLFKLFSSVDDVTQTIGKPGPNITDSEGNSYKTVTIGTQQWMAENLKVSKYSDGTTIPNITNNTQWDNTSTGAWAYYNNDAANNAKYGKLYNWYAVSKTSNGNKNVCPTGWHVPTDAEWTVLTDYLGGESVAGGKMKEVGTTSWNSPNTDAINTSLFTGLPGGYRSSNGYYDDIGKGGSWWSSTENDTYQYHPLTCSLYGSYSFVGRGSCFERYGLSVRCLRD